MQLFTLTRSCFGGLCYLYSMYALVLFESWVTNTGYHFPGLRKWLPHNIDFGNSKSGTRHGPDAVLKNVMLLTLFFIPHSVMARPAIKRRMQKAIPFPWERSVFCLASAAALHLLVGQWVVCPAVFWRVPRLLHPIVQAISYMGVLQTVVSTFLIDHFSLFGLKQSCLGAAYTPEAFQCNFLYKYVRHPLYLGLFITFFATPVMTAGHVLFNAIIVCWMLIAIQLEECDTGACLGSQYTAYKAQVPMLIPCVSVSFKVPSETSIPKGGHTKKT